MAQRCQHTGCPYPATHAVKLCAPDEWDDADHEALIDLRLCEDHVNTAKAQDFLNVAPDLLLALGLTPPNVIMAYIEGVPLSSREFKAFQNMRPKLN